MSTVLSSLRRYLHAPTAPADRWERWSWTMTVVSAVVAITVPTLVGLAALLDNVLGLSVMWSRAVATTLVLGPVFLFMLKLTLSSIQTAGDDTQCTSQTNRVVVAANCCKEVDYEGWYGQMVNLTTDELEFLSERIGEYLEGNDDLNHTEFGFAKGLLDKIEEALD